MPFMRFKHLHFADFYDILYTEGKRNPRKQNMKEVIKMKKEMMKLLKSYIEKYNDIVADLELDEMFGIDIKYDKGKKYVLSDVIYDMASILNITVSIDIKGYIKIADFSKTLFHIGSISVCGLMSCELNLENTGDKTVAHAPIIIETKGRFLTADRMKMLEVKRQYTSLEFRFIFNNSNARISKVSKTTYGKWCEKNGLKYADKKVPQEWIEEIKQLCS